MDNANINIAADLLKKDPRIALRMRGGYLNIPYTVVIRILK
jgi:hypothetical protein